MSYEIECPWNGPANHYAWAYLKQGFNRGAKQALAAIEEASDVVDWEDGIGKMREMKEADFQALKESIK